MKEETKINRIAETIRDTFKLIGIVSFMRDLENIHLYRESERGVDFIATVTPQLKNNKTVGFIYNSTQYSDINRMLEAVGIDNAKLQFPSYTYDPLYHKIAQIETKIDWYMRKVLGFDIPYFWSEPNYISSNPNGHYYLKRNIYGEVVSHIYVLYNEDEDSEVVSGQVCRLISNRFAWVSCNFTGVDECIAAINSMVEVEYLTDVVSKMDTLKPMREDRNYNGIMNIAKGLDVEMYNMRNATKKLLQDALKRLEDDEE